MGRDDKCPFAALWTGAFATVRSIFYEREAGFVSNLKKSIFSGTARPVGG
jgi:hypothetical protein